MKSDMNRIAIMQPYFFPYIGYFQLLYHTDLFVFLDDVNFIKRGWINRNRILINDEPKYLTVPCKNISQNRLIKDIKHDLDKRTREKLLKKVRLAYKRAPYFTSVYPIVKKVFNADTSTISELASLSVKEVCNYLKLETGFIYSSGKYSNTELGRSDRLIDICKKENAEIYINSLGGVELYDKSYFKKKGISLKFLAPKFTSYKQFNTEFTPALSIIDVMMFNAPAQIMEMLKECHLN